jgi:hypothetical protein
MLRYVTFRQENRWTRSGSPCPALIKVPEVPRIDDRILDCSVYLYPTREDAERAERIGGSGFLMSLMVIDNEWMADCPCPDRTLCHEYVATNRHVAIKNPVVRFNTHSGQDTDIVEIKPDGWFFSTTDDLAIASINLPIAAKYESISTESFLTEEIAATQDVGIGDEVFMVGRFIGHDGKQKNSPTLRWGHLAMMPFEPVYHPSNQSGVQQSFLIEIHSVSGYSGSPVFVRPFPTQKMVLAGGDEPPPFKN